MLSDYVNVEGIELIVEQGIIRINVRVVAGNFIMQVFAYRSHQNSVFTVLHFMDKVKQKDCEKSEVDLSLILYELLPQKVF